MSQIHWIKADGNTTVQPSDIPPSLEDMQDFVGGYIEIVRVLHDGQPAQMIVNEEGMVLNLPVNPKATEIYHALSKSQGYDLTSAEDRKRQRSDWLKAKGLPATTPVITLGDDVTPMIHGPAILLEGLYLD